MSQHVCLVSDFPRNGKEKRDFCEPHFFAERISLRFFLVDAFHSETHIFSGSIFWLDAFFRGTHLFTGCCFLRKAFLFRSQENASCNKMRPGKNVISKNNATHKEMRPAKNESRDIFEVQGSVVQKTP